MQGFMGWTAEQGREGNWYATKFVDTEDTRRGKTGIVRICAGSSNTSSRMRPARKRSAR